MQKKRRSPAERARLVAAFRASGMKQKEFADREGITISALQNWLYSPKAQLAATPVGKRGFVRVLESAPAAGVIVRVGDSVSISFAAAPDADYLAVLARALAC
jgi:hypothetical protein